MSHSITTRHRLPQMSGDPADPIDRLLTITGGAVLGTGDKGRRQGGEYDSYYGGRLTVRDYRRLAAGRLVSVHGERADVLLHECAHLVPGGDSMTTDEFVAWYVREALAGLDYRADVRAGTTDLDELARYEEECRVEHRRDPAGTVPGWAVDWIGRTVHQPKAEYLGALCCWWWLGDPEPATPAGWGVKARARFEARVGRYGRMVTT